jgi:hypothetical protein
LPLELPDRPSAHCHRPVRIQEYTLLSLS